jgi:hypothetical protein
VTRLFVVVLYVALLIAPSGASAQASAEIRKAANLMTMSEATLATIALISQRFNARIEEFKWSVDFGDREWVARMGGVVNQKESALTLVGYIWGEEGETLTVGYSGMGSAAGEPMLVNGTAKWLYNQDAKDYQGMDFRQVTKIGRNSFWGWVLGSEIIVGGTVGGVVTVGGSSAITGGLALGAAPWVFAGGAMGGAASLVTISEGAKSLLESDKVPSPPEAPKRPRPPEKGDTLSPRKGEILVALSINNKITGSAIDGIHILEGNYFFEKGVAEGSIYARK